MNFTINEFSGTLVELAALLEKHNMVGSKLNISYINISLPGNEPLTFRSPELVEMVRKEMDKLPAESKYLISAIKITRSLTNCTLKDAKDWYDSNFPEFKIKPTCA